MIREALRDANRVIERSKPDDWVDADEILHELAKSRIAEVREKRGLTQRELGKRLGVPQSQVSRLERNPDSSTLRQLKRVAEALGVAVTDLL